MLEESLLKILVCPVDKGCLMYFADEDLLYNPRLRRAYRIENGIPAMLAERAEQVTEHEHERLILRAHDNERLDCRSCSGSCRSVITGLVNTPTIGL
jgi:uncharacterized protein YbaR (Trm112 family)